MGVVIPLTKRGRTSRTGDTTLGLKSRTAENVAKHENFLVCVKVKEKQSLADMSHTRAVKTQMLANLHYRRKASIAVH